MLPLLFAVLLGAATAPQSTVRPVRLSAPHFGETVQIEARDLPEEAAREAVQAAFAEVAAIERLTDPEAGAGADGGLAALDAAAGNGPRRLDPRLLPALARARDFCFWSERAFGPLGRDLHRLWGLRGAAVAAAPPPDLLDKAAASAACDRLQVDPAKGTAALATGAAVDLWGFAEGLAVDRAVEVLKQHGVRNGYAQVGSRVYRGFGKGPDGRGWSVQLPEFPGMTIPLGRVFLRDQSLAIATARDRPLKVGNATVSPYIHQRTGQPAQGVVATLAAAELALDAQGLAVTLTLTGATDGQLRLGSLSPRPAVLWLLGTGAGEPLQMEYHWGEVPKR